MSAQKKTAIQNLNNSDESVKTVEVLYQKMGDRWYAFSLVDDEMYMGSITEQQIAVAESQGLEKFIEIPEGTSSHDSPEAA